MPHYVDQYVMGAINYRNQYDKGGDLIWREGNNLYTGVSGECAPVAAVVKFASDSTAAVQTSIICTPIWWWHTVYHREEY